MGPPNIYCYRSCNETNINDTYLNEPLTGQYFNLSMYANITNSINSTQVVDTCMDDSIYYNQSLPIFAYEYTDKYPLEVVNMTWFILLAICAALSLFIAIVFFIKTKQDYDIQK